MLIIGRSEGQSIWIDGQIRITAVALTKGGVRLGIDAPEDIGIIREEIADDAKLVEYLNSIMYRKGGRPPHMPPFWDHAQCRRVVPQHMSIPNYFKREGR